MRKDEIRAAIDVEIAAHATGINRLSLDEVHEIYAAEIGKYGAGRDAYQGLRTEVSAALQLKNPAPHGHDPDAAAGPLTLAQRDALHESGRSQVTDKHRLLADHARSIDPNHVDTHHFVQKLHGMALWREVDRIIAEAGISATVGGAA